MKGRGYLIQRKSLGNPLLKNQILPYSEDFLTYRIQRGRKHLWFSFCGWHLALGTMVMEHYDESCLEDCYIILKQLSIEEMLLHRHPRVRQLGLILMSDPKIKHEKLIEKVLDERVSPLTVATLTSRR